MIINNRKDLDAAPADTRERFIAGLAASINKWNWENGDWVIRQNTTDIECFEFTLDDFPDAPTPEKPNYNPDQREAQAERERLDAVTVNRAQGKAVLADQGYLSTIRSIVDNEPEESLLRIGFEDSPTWKRGSAFINQMLDALELTEAQGDALFQAATEIEL